jgi:thiol-disulfide isomerase/thioredoxin
VISQDYAIPWKIMKHQSLSRPSRTFAGAVLAAVGIGTAISGRLAQAKTETPLAPELTGQTWLNTPGGKPISLASRRGHVTVVEFWTFGCSNCRANLPAYAKWHQSLQKMGVEVIGVHTPETDAERNPANVRRQVQQLGITYPVLLDPDYQNWNRWHQQYWPAIYLVDKQGRIRDTWTGELQGAEPDFEARIQKLAAE